MKRAFGSAVLIFAMFAPSAFAALPSLKVTPLNYSAFVNSMTLGPDGAVWFVDSSNNVIGRVTTTAAAKTYAVPTANAGLSDIRTGPDGNLWFLENSKIGRITTAGTITEFPVTGVSLATGANRLAAGADGNVWVVTYSGIRAAISRFSTSGTLLGSTSLAAGAPFPNVKIAPGPGGMWFHNISDNTAGFVSAAGVAQSFSFKTPETAGGLFAAGGLAAGPDGNEWIAHSATVARVTQGGTITEFAVPDGGVIGAVARGNDGNIWFSDATKNKIGRLTLSTATDQGAATIDQTGAGVESPADIIFPGSTAAKTAINQVPNECLEAINPVQFFERSTGTPKPGDTNMALAESSDPPPEKCADLSSNFTGSGDTYRKGFGSIFFNVTNGGPDPSTPTFTALNTGVIGILIGGTIKVRGLSFDCSALLANFVTCTPPASIAKGEQADIDLHYYNSTPAKTGTADISADVTGSVPDQKPLNNKSAAKVKFVDVSAFVQPDDKRAVAPPPAKRKP